MSPMFYFLIVVVAVLPLVFQRNLWVRVVCVFALLALVLLHCTHILALHRLLTVQAVKQGLIQPDQPTPAGFEAAARIVQKLSQGELPFALLLFAAFAVLALLPARQSSPEAETSETRSARSLN